MNLLRHANCRKRCYLLNCYTTKAFFTEFKFNEKCIYSGRHKYNSFFKKVIIFLSK